MEAYGSFNNHMEPYENAFASQLDFGFVVLTGAAEAWIGLWIRETGP